MPASPKSKKTALSKDPSFKTNTRNVRAAIDQTANTLINQGPFQAPEELPQFNPQDYQQQFDGAYQNVVDQFEQTNARNFSKQDADFKQMAAERGWDPSSKAYADAYQMQVLEPQQQARQNAQTQAYQTGLSAQQQAYGQQANTYNTQLGAQNQFYGQAANTFNMPYQQLAALNPYYGQQNAAQMQRGQQQWQTGQNAYDRANQLAATRMSTGASIASARIGADASRDVASINGMNNYLNGLNQYSQTPQYDWQTAAAAGLAQGVGAALGGSLR